MTRLFRTDSDDQDFQTLVLALDKELAVRDGADHAFYAQFNKTNTIRHVVVAFIDDIAIGCGAIKKFEDDAMEVKRMYIVAEKRGLGIAVQILTQLESWSKEMGYNKCVLETGHKQPEAINLYLKCGYVIVPNYGQYIGIDNSVCFEKWV